MTDWRRERRKTQHLFAVRCADRNTHARLVHAAACDGTTVGDELDRLLDLREQWNEITASLHPLGLPGAIPRIEVIPYCPNCSALPYKVPLVDGEDYFYGGAANRRQFAEQYKQQENVS